MPVPKGFRERPADFPSGKCAPGSFRVKVLSRDKRILVCCPRGQFRKGRCRVGTRATKIQTRIGARAGMYGRKRRR